MIVIPECFYRGSPYSNIGSGGFSCLPAGKARRPKAYGNDSTILDQLSSYKK